jgi:hypothetical protein
LTGCKLEDIKEIIKNQNEMIKEQALEIFNLKMRLIVLSQHAAMKSEKFSL